MKPSSAHSDPQILHGQFAGAPDIYRAQESNEGCHFTAARLRGLVRSRGIEPPRAMPTAPSTLRVYLFRHDRMGISQGSAPDMAVSSPRNKAYRGRAALANLALRCKARLKG